ncbi:hypothetical protein HanIR_Chr17g0846631 [Helianthus annuus]|nr:hypothetical protein HanIR_Chr17g0846631 [Helianthus annuus]
MSGRVGEGLWIGEEQQWLRQHSSCCWSCCSSSFFLKTWRLERWRCRWMLL